MGYVLSYSLMTGVVLTPLYLVIKLFINNSDRHKFNRACILSAYIVALALPALPRFSYGVGYEVRIEPLMQGNFELAADIAPSGPSLSEIALAVLICIYFIGVAFCIVREIVAWHKLFSILKSSDKVTLQNGIVVYLHRLSGMSPFSSCNKIVMSHADYDVDGRMILTHELKHIARHHWADLLLSEIVAIFIWYNPVGWLMKSELQTVHEYEADEEVLRSGVDIREYQLLLIKKAVGGRLPSITNSLDQSNLSKRINMMLRRDSSKFPQWRAIAAIPALALGALVLNVDAVASALQTLSDTKVSESFAYVQVSGRESAEAPSAEVDSQSDKKVYTAAEQMPRYPGGEAEMMKYVARNLQYPEEAIKENAQGNIVVQFVVLNTGKIGDVTVIRGENEALKKEAIRVVKSFPDFIPGRVNGKPVNVQYTLPIVFKLTDDNRSKTEKDANTVDIDPSRGKIAQFPGGEIKMMEFLSKNIKYPTEAVKNNVQGKVHCTFTVSKEGKIGDITVQKGVSPELDAEAVRVIKLLPDFIPATLDGKPVASWYNLPISFRLSSESKTISSKNDQSTHVIIDGKPGNIDKVCKDSIVINANKTKQIFGDSGADEVVVIATKE